MASKILDRVIQILIIYICVLIIGFIFVGSNIFNYNSNSLAVATFGLAGTVFTVIYKRGINKEIYFTTIILFAANVIFIGKPLIFTYLLRDTIFFISLYSALIIYIKFHKKYFYSPRFFRSLVLALFYGISNVLATLLLLNIFSSSKISPFEEIFINAKHAMVIGLGIGIGMDLYKKMSVQFSGYQIRNKSNS